MKGLPRHSQLFIALLISSGFLTICLSLHALAPHIFLGWTQVIVGIVCIICIAIANGYMVDLPPSTSGAHGCQAMGSVGHIAALVIFPLPTAILISAAGTVLDCLRHRRSIVKTSFNSMLDALTVGASGLPLALYGGPSVLFSANHFSLLSILIGAAMVVVAYAVNTALFAAHMAFLTQRNIAYTWRVNHWPTVLPEIATLFIGLLTGCLWNLYPFLVIFMLIPIIITHVSYANIRRLEQETIAAVTSLADMVDLRDHYTHEHSRRVATLAQQLARAMSLPDDKVEEIYLAARVHDLGKMLMPEEILNKRGPLNDHEYRIMQQHPEKGAEILGRYKEFARSLPVVLYHHERFDGRGYPAGLSGKNIPQAAHIVAHADAYDAMTSNRPYRRGLPPREALRRIQNAVGSQFDPDITLHFLAMMKRQLAEQGVELPEDASGSRAFTDSDTGYKSLAHAQSLTGAPLSLVPSPEDTDELAAPSSAAVRPTQKHVDLG